MRWRYEERCQDWENRGQRQRQSPYRKRLRELKEGVGNARLSVKECVFINLGKRKRERRWGGGVTTYKVTIVKTKCCSVKFWHWMLYITRGCIIIIIICIWVCINYSLILSGNEAYSFILPHAYIHTSACREQLKFNSCFSLILTKFTN